MKSAKVEGKVSELSRQARALEQANSGLRSKCKALEHILAHQDLMAALQQQINSRADAWHGEPSPAGTEPCSTVALDSSLTHELLHEQWAHNPLLQCFNSSPDQGVYLAVRDSSAQDIGQAWLLLLSTLSLALHVHDMQPQQAPNSDMLCKAVTDCNRFIAAVNLLKEDVWPQLWHLNLLTGVSEVPSRTHWQAAMAAAAPTAAQLQEARDVLAVTTSKLKPMAEEVGRQLQEVAVMVNSRQDQQEPNQQEPQGRPPGNQEQRCNQCQHTDVQQRVGGTCVCEGLLLEQAVSPPACSSSGIARVEGCRASPLSQAKLPSVLPATSTGCTSLPASSQAVEALTAVAAAAAAAGRGSCRQSTCTAGQPTNASAAGCSTPTNTRQAQHSSSCPACVGSGSFMQVLSSLESREEAMDALSSRLSTWRVLRMMVGALTFLLRPDQLARLYLYSMPYMPIGCLLYDEIGSSDLQCSDDTCSSC